MVSDSGNLPCDQTNTIYRNESLTSVKVEVEVVDQCNNDGELTVVDGSNNLVSSATVAGGRTRPSRFNFPVPSHGRIDLNCNGSGGHPGGCQWTITPTKP